MRSLLPLPLLFTAACIPVGELGPADALASLVFDGEETIEEVRAMDVDGDDLDELLVRTREGDVDTAYLFLGSDLVAGLPLTPDDAHATFRGQFEGIDTAGDPDGDGRSGITMGNVLGWSVYWPDDLIDPGTRVALDAPLRISAGQNLGRVLRVTSGDLDGNGRDELIASAVEEGYDCGWFCGWWRPRERIAYLPDEAVPVAGEETVQFMTRLSRTILDVPHGGYPLLVAGDLDNDGTAEVVSGGQRNYAAVAMDTKSPYTKYEVADRHILLDQCYRDVPMSPCTRPIVVERAGDVDGDGYADLLVSKEGRPPFLISGQQVTDASVYFADRFDGTRPPKSDKIDWGTHVVGVGDLDGDGLADLAGVDGPGTVVVRLGTDNLKRQRPAVELSGFGKGEPSLFLAGDLDGDDFTDLVVVSRDGTWASILAPVDGLVR